MGTTDLKALERKEQSALSWTLSRQVLVALRDAANALAAVASVALGETASGSPKILPLPGALGHLPDDSYTVVGCVRDFLHAKARACRSDRYLRALKVSLSSFVKGRAHVPLASVTFSDVEKWLDGNSWSNRTKQGYLSDVRVMFHWALKRGLVSHNPASSIELPAVENALVSLHDPATVKKVLEFARGYDLRLCRLLAIRYFSGLRSSEAERLEEKEIGDKYIEVTAAKSKTRQRRLVTIQPNLRLWLDLGGEVSMGDIGNRFRFFYKAARAKLGIEFPKNVTRHSFVSYHLAHFGNAGATALQAGHSEQMLFAHYRELVTPEAARAFFEIVPEAVAPTRTGRALRRGRKRNWRRPPIDLTL